MHGLLLETPLVWDAVLEVASGNGNRDRRQRIHLPPLGGFASGDRAQGDMGPLRDIKDRGF